MLNKISEINKVSGVTSQLSLARPTPEEQRATILLKKTLQLLNIFETRAQLKYRLSIINKLNSLVEEWISETLSSKNIKINVMKKSGGRVYTFGSSCLGVHSKGADIDAVCIVSSYVSRYDFFTKLFWKLKNEITITKCRAIENAFVPVIKMNYGGIDVDLLFANLDMAEIPENINLKDDNLLHNLDIQSIRSLNGYRVANQIIQLVPNLHNFRLTLHTIKQWAKQRGIYSNAFGFFGGVTWSILVAKTCQLYPIADSATLVKKFFFMYSNWEWPTPVTLKNFEKNNLKLPVWNPKQNVTDQYHLMPIITPAYPESNTTYNVSRSNFKIIRDEIKKANGMINEIISGECSWERLFKPLPFFDLYKDFIVISVKSKTSLDHIQRKGLIEAKLRFLVINLEQNCNISMAHINTKCFDKMNKIDPDGLYCSLWFIGFEFIKTDKENTEVKQCNEYFINSLYSQASVQALDTRDLFINVCYIHQNELNKYLDTEILSPVECNKENHSLNTQDRSRLSSKRRMEHQNDNAEKRVKISI